MTAHDYLLRNFNLFRLEATYEIREDIADVLQRIGADRCWLFSSPIFLHLLPHCYGHLPLLGPGLWLLQNSDLRLQWRFRTAFIDRRFACEWVCVQVELW